MKEHKEILTDKAEIRSAIWDTINEIDRACDPEAACIAIADIVQRLDAQLLWVKISDLDGKREAVRPYTAFSESVITEGKLLMQNFGGCVLHKESLARMRPFLISDISHANYKSFMERRFLKELKNLDYVDIFVIPTIVGRGQAVVAIGLGEALTRQKRTSIVDMVGHFVAAMLSRFPEVGRLFEEKRLSTLEARILQMRCEGADSKEITLETGFSEITQHYFIEAAKRKLGATNNLELGRLATLSGEIGS